MPKKRVLGPRERRILEARIMLDKAGDLNAPKDLIDALCRWIGDMEQEERNARTRETRPRRR